MLDIIWNAKFKDGSELCQYKYNGEEVKFQEVLDKQSDLVEFSLVRRKDMFMYVVDLTNGCISAQSADTDIIKPRVDMLRNKEYNYRLIYFREVTRHFDQNLKEVTNPDYVYFLGFQYTDENGCNQKRIMRILPTGEFVIN